MTQQAGVARTAGNVGAEPTITGAFEIAAREAQLAYILY
jgi:hypothetical protein